MILEGIKHVGMARILILIVILSSCSMEHHLNKAINKGYKIETVTKEVHFTDTLTLNGKDSIIERLIKIDCPEPVIETRWKTRFDYKRFNDSLKHIRHIHSDSLDNAFKTLKQQKNNDRVNNKLAKKIAKYNKQIKNTAKRQENKRSLWWLWLLIGFALSFIVKIVLKYFGLR